jgi:hypothetical protein
LSVGPSGDTVAWIRWKGDNRKLCVEGVEPGRSTQFRTSVCTYAWLNSQTLIYLYGSRPRLIDVASGATRRFGPGLREHVRQGVTGATDELRALADLPADQLWEFYGDVQVVGDDVWFSATLAEQRGPRRVDGLFRTDHAGSHLTLVATMPANDHISAFFALPDRSVLLRVETYQGVTVVADRLVAVGPLADFLDSGWVPLLESNRAEFGFHALP